MGTLVGAGRPIRPSPPPWHPPIRVDVTDTFDAKRFNADGTSRPHNGVDLAAHVVAVADGQVFRVDRADDGHNDANGNAVWLLTRTPEGVPVRVCYLHLDSIRVKLHDKVTRGQVLGNIGETGKATGVHLHLGVYGERWEALNPADLLTWFVS